jgi:small-conductance mechanosensitive channel
LVLDRLTELFMEDAWWGDAAYIALFYLGAWIVHRLARRIATSLVRLRCLTSNGRQPRPERRETLRSVIASAISFTAFAGATLASLGRFVRLDGLVWVVGLFSAAFGLGARPLIGDVLIGIGLVFEDIFAVGELSDRGRGVRPVSGKIYT